MLDVLNCVEHIGQSEFTLGDVYKSENYLSELHPENNHVKPKIRQQLQVLRDAGVLEFVSRGGIGWFDYTVRHYKTCSKLRSHLI